MRGSAWIYAVSMAQFVLKIEKLSHIIRARGSQDLRSLSPIMAPVITWMSNIKDLSIVMMLLSYFSRYVAWRTYVATDSHVTTKIFL